ncbi:Rho GTPase-activating protein 1-like protein [Drosera capensis]
MTLFFRSKSCRLGTNPPRYYEIVSEDEEEDDEDEDEDGFREVEEEERRRRGQQMPPILGMVAAVLRRSLVTCSVERDEDDLDDIEISCPTDVKHIAHVTFDRFNGFLGLPVEFQPEVPCRVPSASVRVFGVSPRSMQCSIDQRGNSVPTILLMMQKRLYEEGGLQAEGIFRINADNSQEEWVRSHLNKGVIPLQIDVHCLAGLIKAWFRELPTGVLDTLRPEQVMHCNTEDECTELVLSLSQTEAALLDWAINLMADVVQNEHLNKMNARNIAMVFAPNMTQMLDPLTALIHAVQVMNFLKTLIVKTLQDREECASIPQLPSPSSSFLDSNIQSHSSNSDDQKQQQSSNSESSKQNESNSDETHVPGELPAVNHLGRSISLDGFEYGSRKISSRIRRKYEVDCKLASSSPCSSSPVMSGDRSV